MQRDKAFQEEIKADYQRLFDAILDYAATGNREAKQKMRQMEEIVAFKFQMLCQARSGRRPGNEAPTAGQPAAFQLPICSN